jgi:hypothetical protein
MLAEYRFSLPVEIVWTAAVRTGVNGRGSEFARLQPTWVIA